MNFKLNIVVCCVSGRVPWFEACHPYSRVGEELRDMMTAITARLIVFSGKVNRLYMASTRNLVAREKTLRKNFYLGLREKLLACGPLRHGWSTGSVSTTC